jgi:hypothetical protein
MKLASGELDTEYTKAVLGPLRQTESAKICANLWLKDLLCGLCELCGYINFCPSVATFFKNFARRT